MADTPSAAPEIRLTLDPAARAAGIPPATPHTMVLRAEGQDVVIEAARRLTLRVGASSLTLDADGTILLHGVRVAVAADDALTTYSGGAHTIRGATVDIN